MTQLLAASERSRSACSRGSATMTMVPSRVAINCMPVIAKIAIPRTCVVRRCREGSVDSLEPPAADMDCQPTETRKRYSSPPGCRALQLSVVDRVLDFLRVRHLVRGVADEQRDDADDHRDCGD